MLLAVIGSHKNMNNVTNSDNDSLQAQERCDIKRIPSKKGMTLLFNHAKTAYLFIFYYLFFYLAAGQIF